MALPQIAFDREQHAYTCNGVSLASVTTAIGELKPKFDRERISLVVASRDGLTQQQVLDDWDSRSLAALAKGSAVHSYIEDLFKNRDDSVVESMNDLPELAGFKKAWSRLQKSHKAIIEHQELIVGDPELGIAGMVDAIALLHPASALQSRHIFDWKTGRKFDSSNRYEKLLAPFDDLDNCQLSMYSLQTSLYRLILERAGWGGFGDSYLVHLRADGTHYTYRGRDYRGRLEKWLIERKLIRDWANTSFSLC